MGVLINPNFVIFKSSLANKQINNLDSEESGIQERYSAPANIGTLKAYVGLSDERAEARKIVTNVMNPEFQKKCIENPDNEEFVRLRQKLKDPKLLLESCKIVRKHLREAENNSSINAKQAKMLNQLVSILENVSIKKISNPAQTEEEQGNLNRDAAEQVLNVINPSLIQESKTNNVLSFKGEGHLRLFAVDKDHFDEKINAKLINNKPFEKKMIKLIVEEKVKAEPEKSYKQKIREVREQVEKKFIYPFHHNYEDYGIRVSREHNVPCFEMGLVGIVGAVSILVAGAVNPGLVLPAFYSTLGVEGLELGAHFNELWNAENAEIHHSNWEHIRDRIESPDTESILYTKAYNDRSADEEKIKITGAGNDPMRIIASHGTVIADAENAVNKKFDEAIKRANIATELRKLVLGGPSLGFLVNLEEALKQNS